MHAHVQKNAAAGGGEPHEESAWIVLIAGLRAHEKRPTDRTRRNLRRRVAIVDVEAASSVPVGSGPLLAAGPELLAALQRIVELVPVGSPAHDVASNALEQFAEREGITLADWEPGTTHLQPLRPSLRIAGVAT